MLRSVGCLAGKSEVSGLIPEEESRWLKRWPTDLMVPGSSPDRGGNPSNRKRGYTAYSFSSPQPNIVLT